MKRACKNLKSHKKTQYTMLFISVGGCVMIIIIFCTLYFGNFFSQEYVQVRDAVKSAIATTSLSSQISMQSQNFLLLDTVAYDKKLIFLANYPVPKTSPKAASSTKTKASTTPSKPVVHLWPVKTVYPLSGALLPFKRIVAYYGNLYSKQMGVLGQYPEDEMLSRLNTVAKGWSDADPRTPVVTALDYIAITAQGSAGADGKYRARMPFSEIDKIIAMAQKNNSIVILDIQVGLSTVQTEVPLLEKYLKMPQVHLALDPEFSMKTGAKPGTVIGTMDATDINFAATYLAKLVRDNNLPPKILIVHRFTEEMVTHYKNITPLPEVQIVMDMDGWGSQTRKIGTYQAFIYGEPVQFTGFKLFYKNDVREPGSVMMTPQQVLKLTPQPSFIQYQ